MRWGRCLKTVQFQGANKPLVKQVKIIGPKQNGNNCKENKPDPFNKDEYFLTFMVTSKITAELKKNICYS